LDILQTKASMLFQKLKISKMEQKILNSLKECNSYLHAKALHDTAMVVDLLPVLLSDGGIPVLVGGTVVLDETPVHMRDNICVTAE